MPASARPLIKGQAERKAFFALVGEFAKTVGVQHGVNTKAWKKTELAPGEQEAALIGDNVMSFV